MTIVETVIFSIPEAVAITWLASSLLGNKKWESIIKIGVIMGITSYFLRLFTGAFILNVFFYTAVLIILFHFFHQRRVFENTICVIMAISLYLMMEFLNLKLLETVFGLNLALLSDDLILRLLCFIPQLFLAVITALLINFFNFTVFPRTHGSE